MIKSHVYCFLTQGVYETESVCQFLYSLCTATVLSGSGPHLARGIIIPSGWLWAG